jgi:hypothetical protein
MHSAVAHWEEMVAVHWVAYERLQSNIVNDVCTMIGANGLLGFAAKKAAGGGGGGNRKPLMNDM